MSGFRRSGSGRAEEGAGRGVRAAGPRRPGRLPAAAGRATKAAPKAAARGPRTESPGRAFLAAAAAAALAAGCAPAWTGPAASAELLSVRARSGESGSGFSIAYRVEAGASGDRLTRFGLSARGRSDRGEYRAGELREVGLPPGACLYGEIRIEFDDPAERYEEGSAAIEGFWAE